LRKHYLIETDELEALIKKGNSDLRIINATWYMPNAPNNALDEHKKCRITENTQFLDIDHVADKSNPLPHTFPHLARFTECMREIKIRRTDNIVVYDTPGLFTCARAAFMLRYFGAEHVRILNGGLKKWLAEKRPTYGGNYVPGIGLPDGGDFNYREINPKMLVRDINQVHKTAYYITHKATDTQIVDARAAARFNGEVPEPRAGIRSGHITGSVNVPFQSLANPDGTLKSDKEIAKVNLNS
jgi:thiosulfate/3-mercaptopyruvate sulfurtransferase